MSKRAMAWKSPIKRSSLVTFGLFRRLARLIAALIELEAGFSMVPLLAINIIYTHLL
jgi:hypothetical protein